MPSGSEPAWDGLRIRVLGPLEVMVDGAPLVVDTRKALAILALLAVEQRPYAREELAGLLWPEADDESARGALRRTLSVLRAALGGRWLVVDRATARLDPAADVDVRTFEDGRTSDDIGVLRATADLARGPFLAGFGLRDSPGFDDWRAAREALLDRSVAALLVRLADALLDAGEVAAATSVVARRLERDPLDEDAHRRMMLVHAQAGDRSAAIRQYRACVAILDRELGVAPLAETTTLYEAIRDGRVEAEHRIPPPRRAPEEPHPNRPASAPPLLGREAELEQLLAAHARAAADGVVAVIEGEAGIGKTSLLDGLARRVAAAGGRIVRADAHAAESGIPYGPVVQLVRDALAAAPSHERLDALPDGVRREIARLVDLPGVRPRPHADGPGARTRLLEALAAALAAVVDGDPPGVLAVDDIQHADDATFETLIYLAHRLVGRRLLLVLAWRPEDLTPSGAAFADAIRALPRADVIVVDRLRPDVLEQVARTTSGDHLLDDATIAAIVERAEGLPMYVVEAVAAGGPSATGGAMGALLRERMARCSETAGQVLTAAAVIGRSFDLPTLRRTSGRTDDETVDALDELVGRGLVRELGQAADGALRYDFTHGLLRDAAYAAASLARRRLLHRRVAEALHDAPGARDDLARLALVAAHERDAGRDAEAAEAFRVAGQRAADVWATQDAIVHLEAALALGHPAPTELHARLGELRMRSGDYAGALTSLERAASLADPAVLAPIERRLAAVHLRRGDLPAADGHLIAAMTALDGAGSDDADSRQERARILADRSGVATRRGDPATGAVLASDALRLADDIDDDGVRLIAHRMAALAARARGDLVAAATALDASLELATRLDDVAATVAARNALALTSLADGAPETACAFAEAALGSARRIGDRHLEAVVENTLADALHAAGERDASLEHLKRAVALFADVGGRPAELDPGIWQLQTW